MVQVCAVLPPIMTGKHTTRTIDEHFGSLCKARQRDLPAAASGFDAGNRHLINFLTVGNWKEKTKNFLCFRFTPGVGQG